VLKYICMQVILIWSNYWFWNGLQ